MKLMVEQLSPSTTWQGFSIGCKNDIKQQQNCIFVPKPLKSNVSLKSQETKKISCEVEAAREIQAILLRSFLEIDNECEEGNDVQELTEDRQNSVSPPLRTLNPVSKVFDRDYFYERQHHQCRVDDDDVRLGLLSFSPEM